MALVCDDYVSIFRTHNKVHHISCGHWSHKKVLFLAVGDGEVI
jgi:hypothetical protein